MGDKLSFASGRFAFSVDGQFAGFVKKVNGGNIKGNVVTHNLGTSNIQKKHLATIEYDQLTFEVAVGQAQPVWEWIKASFDKNFQQKDCELIAADFNFKAQAVRTFVQAYIAEVGFPALDGSSKDAVYITMKIDPQTIAIAGGDQSLIQGTENANTKKALCSNFRLDIDGLPCTRVAKIDAMTWKQKVAKDEVGLFRNATKHAAALEVPNIKLTISMADWDPWMNWFKSFVIDGKCADGDEKKGSLTLLGPDMSEELLAISFDHIGIISMEQEAVEANKDSIARFVVELYCEEMYIDSFAF